jgi:serine/threonine-protein kinase
MAELSTLSPTGAKAAEAPGPGTVLGHFVLVERLGAGGMGVVYSAYDLRLNRLVAIKRVRHGASTEARARMVREAQAMARLSHRNVVVVHEVTTIGDDTFIAMELVQGPTLRAWLDERPRPRRAVLAAFIDAGRGLAAAHRAGIIHRDFKPENVLIAPDGHAQVTDFGLAKLDDGVPEPPAGPGPPGLLVETETGTRMGTPRYMSPEQRTTGVVDARTDQYAFAVALFEALTGAHPLEPRRRRLPRWLRAALAPALAEDPAARHPTLAPLLARLEAGPRARRRVLTVAAAAAMLAVVGLAVRRPPPPAPCLGAEARLAGVWDADVAAAVRASFLGTGRSYAGATYAQVAAALDGYAGGWARMRTEACEAAVVRHDQTPALYDRRVACLDRRLAQLAALTRLYARAPAADVLDRAAQSARGLAPLDDCADAKALLAAYPPPDDRSARIEVAALRGRLDHAAALAAATRTRAALDVVAPIVVEARALDYPPVTAETLALLGRLQKDAAPEAAVVTLSEAVRAAGGARDDAIMYAALEDLIWTYGLSLRRVGEARALVPVAEGALLRAGNPPRDQAALSYVRAVVEDNARNSAEARRLHEEALALRERSLGPDDAEVYRSLVGLGILLQRSGAYDEARARFERALDLCARTVGPSHPFSMFVLVNLASVELDQGRFGASLAHGTRALAIGLETYGPDHPYLAAVLTNVAVAQAGLGHPEAGRPNLERARVIRERAYGADAALVADTLAVLGNLDGVLGRHGDALAEYRRAIEIEEARLGPEHADLARPLQGIGEVLIDEGRTEEARPYLERALALQVKAYGADGVRAAIVRSDLAECEERDAVRAVALAEPALAVIERAGERPVVIGRARLALARALWAEGRDRPRALALAEAARRDLEAAAARPTLARLTTWLAARRR